MNYKRLFVQNSCIHLIIASYNRNPIFIKNIDLLRKAFKNSKNYFDYDIVAICVLPDHIHTVLKPKNVKDYPKIITSIKYYFSHHYNIELNSPTHGYKNKGEKGIFQRRYFEHTIINEIDLNNQINYIHYNPIKHNYSKHVKDWKFSSFHKFVKEGMYDINWGNNDDIKDIKNLNFE